MIPIIRIIKYNSDDYIQELGLRDEVLRKPLGMSLYDENLDRDKTDTHIAAFVDGKLIGVLILTVINENTLKMRQVAVNESYQNLKIGTALVLFAESHAKNNGFTAIVLHARKVATGFYLKLGYHVQGNEFLEINLPHYEMIKCF